jgi:type I restriction enzyme R subunit
MNTGIQPDTERDAAARVSKLLRALGWQPLHASEGLLLREGRDNEVLLRTVLEERLQAINSFEHQGRRRSLSMESIAAAVQALQRSTQEEISHANEKIWSLLKIGTPVREPLGDDTRSLTIRYVDWEKPENNSYHLIERFPVAGPSATCTPDCVLFVNGMPFVVIEVKSTRSSGDSKQQLDETISQLQSYQRAQSIPQLFHYAQLLLAVSTKSAAYGVVGAEREHWSEWRETQVAPADIQSLIDGSIEDPFSAEEIPPIVNEQDRLLYALCRPPRLLDLIRWFTFFHDRRRIMARYYQYSAVQAVLRQVTKPETDGRRPGGVVWHTQGSGKSYTMGMLSRVLLDVFAKQKARVLVVSDRGELANQMHRDLLATGIDCRQATTGRELRSLLSDPQVRAITTVIQKFGTAANRDVLVADSPNIFVLVDEAHRTQSGSLAHSMRWMLPRACFIGFTGTPVLRTLEAFGQVIASYKFEEAIVDHALLPVYWEGHSAGTQAKVEHDLMKRFAAELLTDGDPPALRNGELNPFEDPRRIRAIAADIAAHFSRHFSGSPLKGIVVSPNRKSAVLFKRCLDDIGTVSSEVVISFEERDYSEASTLLYDFRRDIVQKFGTEARYEADATKRFSDAEDPKLLIVVDKLLTGLDVPRNSVLYITRPLKGHVLMQAIARTNRPYEGKNHGLVVDYVGLIDHLTQLSSVYGSSLGIRDTGSSRELLQKPAFVRTAQTLHAEARAPSRRVPERKENPPAPFERLCEEILQRELGLSQLLIPSEVVQKVAAQIAGAIFLRRKVDWASDSDVQNQMKTAIEDALYDMQAEEGVLLPLASVDAIMDFCVESARKIAP